MQNTKQSPPPPPPPSSSSSSSSSSHHHLTLHLHPPSMENHHHHHHSPPPLPSTTTTTRSDPNTPYPTTFVQADTTSFKKVVQMLTGSSDTAKLAAATRPDTHLKNPIPLMKSGPNKKPSRLYERRNSMKAFKINPVAPGSPRRPGTPEILSPGMLNFPALVLSPVTPLVSDLFNRSPATGDSPNLNVEEEDKAIAEKGFYLHPSPANTPMRESEPRLLPLFPVTSPRVSGSS